MFQTLLAALSAVTGLSVQGAANRKYYDLDLTREQLRRFIGACLQVLMLSSSVVFLVIMPFHTELARWLGLEPNWVLWAVIASAGSFIVNIRLGQWQVRKQAKPYGILQISQSLFNLLLSLVLVVIMSQGAEGRITAQIWVNTAFAMFALYLLHKDKLLGLTSWSPDYIKEALAFGVPLIPHVAGIFLLNSVDRIVINSQLGLSQAGIYMVAAQLSMVMALVFDAINKAYVPWLFERLKSDIAAEKQKIVKYTYLYFALALLVAALAFAIGPFAVTLIAGNKYAEAGQIIGWLALGQAFNGMYLMITNYIFYSKRTGLLSLASISSGLINVALLLILINFFDLTGAAMALSISMAIRFGLSWWVAQRRHPMPWFNLNTQH